MGDRDELREIFLTDDGQPVRWPWPDRTPANPEARRLLAYLGVVGVPEADMPVANPNLRDRAPNDVLKNGEKAERVQHLSHREWGQEQPAVSRCGLCGWTFSGTAAEGREAFAKHRAEKHADLPTRPKARSERQRAEKAREAAAERAQSIAAREAQEETPEGDTTTADSTPAAVAEPETEDTDMDTVAPTFGRRADGTTWSRRTMTRDEAIERTTATLRTLDHVPTRNEWHERRLAPSASTLDRIFGHYNEAVRACGYALPAPKISPTVGRDEMIAAFQAFAAKHGRPPSAKEWKLRAPGRPTQHQVAAEFGSWNAGLAAAALTAPKNGQGRPPLTERAVLAEREPVAGETPVSQPSVSRSDSEPGRAPAAVMGPVTPPELPLEAASRSANTDEPSNEGEKQEPRLGPAIYTRLAADWLVALARIEGIASTASDFAPDALNRITQIAREALDAR